MRFYLIILFGLILSLSARAQDGLSAEWAAMVAQQQAAPAHAPITVTFWVPLTNSLFVPTNLTDPIVTNGAVPWQQQLIPFNSPGVTNMALEGPTESYPYPLSIGGQLYNSALANTIISTNSGQYCDVSYGPTGRPVTSVSGVFFYMPALTSFSSYFDIDLIYGVGGSYVTVQFVSGSSTIGGMESAPPFTVSHPWPMTNNTWTYFTAGLDLTNGMAIVRAIGLDGNVWGAITNTITTNGDYVANYRLGQDENGRDTAHNFLFNNWVVITNANVNQIFNPVAP